LKSIYCKRIVLVKNRLKRGSVDRKREKYRSVFTSGYGPEVLNDMALECGFYDNLDTPEDMALFNYFRLIIQNIGVWDVAHVENTALMNKLLELPFVPGEEDASGI